MLMEAQSTETEILPGLRENPRHNENNISCKYERKYSHVLLVRTEV